MLFVRFRDIQSLEIKRCILMSQKLKTFFMLDKDNQPCTQRYRETSMPECSSKPHSKATPIYKN